MDVDEIFNRLISQLNLVKDERMAVVYASSNIGDFYSLCSSFEYAEKTLGREYIILFFSEKHSEIIGWFEYDGYRIRSFRVSDEECFLMRNSSIEIKNKYCDHFVFWNCGDEKFRALTINSSPEFAPILRKPRCISTEILTKYPEIKRHKTVLIIPEAQTIQPFPVWFWNVAAQIFRYLGFSVIFNASEKQTSVYNGKCILIPLADVIGFVNECGYVFGTRSGFFDVISSCDAEMMVLSTKFYQPIDRVFHIENDDERIRTFYYEDRDPYFMNTEPISFVKKHYSKINETFFELIRDLCKCDTEQCCKIKDASVTAYSCVGFLNKYTPQRDNTKIAPFKEVIYSCETVNGRLVFKIYDIDVDKFRFDYEVFVDERSMLELNDLHNNFFSLPLAQSGEYYVHATITDLSTWNQEYFDTDRTLYISPTPASLDKLFGCEDFYSYVVALEKFSQYITVYISTRDTHTFYKKDKSTQVLRVLKLLDLKTNFESTYRYSYIGVVDNGNVITELLSADQALTYNCEIDGNKVNIESSGYNVSKTNRTLIKININGRNFAVNERGLNFVVWDKRSNKMLDSVCFDTFSDCRAYRK